MKKILFFILAIIFTITQVNSAEFTPTKRNIEIIVPFPAGGAVDTTSRMVAEIFEKNGWKSVVINKPGADQTVGANHVAQSAPDGHTLLITGNGAMDANIVFNSPGRNYDENSLEGVGIIGYGTYVLVVSNESPVKNYDEFKKYVKANPNKFKIGFFNINTAVFIKEWAKIEGLPEPTIVPYKGSAPQIADILGGHIEFTFDTYAATNQLYSAEKLKIIATLDNRNLDKIQKVKGDKSIVALSNLSSDLQQGPWHGIFVSAKTDKKIKNEIHQVLLAGLKQKEYVKKLEELQMYHLGDNGDELDQLVKRLREFYKKTLPK